MGSAVFVGVEGAASLPEGAAWERAGPAAGAAMSTSNLTVIESARISSIIEEALEKLSFLASITPDVMAHRDELSQIVGDEITRIIQEQRGLELRYEELIAQRSSLKALSNKAKYKENQELIKEVARALRESTKELCRNLKGNPNIAENLSKIQTERSNLQNLLSKTLRELRENSFSTLTTTVEEEKARNDMILEVIAKEKEVSAAVKKLQEDLSSERHQHEAEVEERNEIISKLKEELQEVRTKSAIETKYLQKESRARLQSLNRIYNQARKPSTPPSPERACRCSSLTLRASHSVPRLRHRHALGAFCASVDE